MKYEMEMNESSGATAFDLPNNMKPAPYNQIYYGNQYVPRPTNNAAKVCNPNEIMNHVLKAK